MKNKYKKLKCIMCHSYNLKVIEHNIKYIDRNMILCNMLRSWRSIKINSNGKIICSNVDSFINNDDNKTKAYTLLCTPCTYRLRLNEKLVELYE